jgi:hypothetical protein
MNERDFPHLRKERERIYLFANHPKPLLLFPFGKHFGEKIFVLSIKNNIVILFSIFPSALLLFAHQQKKEDKNYLARGFFVHLWQCPV